MQVPGSCSGGGARAAAEREACRGVRKFRALRRGHRRTGGGRAGEAAGKVGVCNPQAWRGREDAPRPWETFSKHLPPSEQPRPSGQQCLSANHAAGHLIPLPSPSKTGPRSPDPMARARGAPESLARAQPRFSRGPEVCTSGMRR